MELTGKHVIGDQLTGEVKQRFAATDPTTGEELTPAFNEATSGEADQAMDLAAKAFDDFRNRSPEERASLLEAIATGVESLGEELLTRAHQETGLPMKRLTGERTRAVNQARLFANLIREGSWVDARIDQADRNREPASKPDVRRMLIAVGPVVVFGASNFPLAISVIGTDTLSALGAGCPVVVKGHPGHPGTCELLANVVREAVTKCGLPGGIFSMLQGTSNEVGLALVRHAATEAVAFTGSLAGGRALYDAAAKRERPIPVYAEMGSTNPVFVLPGALTDRRETIAKGYIQSVTLGTGQFCTNPGLLFGLKGPELDRFAESVRESAQQTPPATMLHSGIQKHFRSGIERLTQTPQVNLLAESQAQDNTSAMQAECHIFETDAKTFLNTPSLHEEYFGPSSIITRADSAEDLETIAENLTGQLTATLHGTPEDLKQYRRLVEILHRKAGRLIFNGFPTGIEVCAAMHHGGPYPATTHSHFTSIGTASILRFVRPICYQDFPNDALPPELKDENPRGIWRLVDNEFTWERI